MVTIEERVSRLEGVYEQVDSRLDDLNLSMNALRTDMNTLRTDMTSKFAEVNSRINTLYVVLAGSWVTMMVAIIGLYFKG